MVIHGCVDGYSRLLTFLHASSNNEARMVLKLFQEAEIQYGLPMRIGVDAGRENVLVRTYMQQKRHDVNGSVLVGKSCQNQRIERMWVDNWNNATHVYHDIFVLTEPKHMWALHYVFIALQG